MISLEANDLKEDGMEIGPRERGRDIRIHRSHILVRWLGTELYLVRGTGL